MAHRSWFITGVSSGFGRELMQQLSERGDRAIGTARTTSKNNDVRERYPDNFRSELLDMTDAPAIREVLDRSSANLGRIYVIISNAGYGPFGAAEDLTDAQVEHIVATNLVGPIQLMRAALPRLRAQGGGRMVQISSYGGQFSFAGNSMHRATKWGIEGFVESVAQEVAPFGIGMTIVEPGGARTAFRSGSARLADLMPYFDETPAHGFLGMVDPMNGLTPDEPARMAAQHRERRSASGSAPPGPRHPGAGNHPDDTAHADRRLRSPDRARRLHGFPPRGMTSTGGTLESPCRRRR